MERLKERNDEINSQLECQIHTAKSAVDENSNLKLQLNQYSETVEEIRRKLASNDSNAPLESVSDKFYLFRC